MRIGWAILIVVTAVAASGQSQDISPPETAAGRHQRGVDYHLQRRLDEAAREYSQALALDPPRATWRR